MPCENINIAPEIDPITANTNKQIPAILESTKTTYQGESDLKGPTYRSPTKVMNAMMEMGANNKIEEPINDEMSPILLSPISAKTLSFPLG